MVLPIDLATSDVPVPAAEDFTKELITLWKETKGRLEAQQTKDKKRADRSRRDAGISVGDFVLLSTRHLKLKGVSPKLKPKYVGPYKVLA